jgi:hypothetical protein
MSFKITITSIENPAHSYAYEGETLSQTIAALAAGIAVELDFEEYPASFGLLLATVGQAIQSDGGFAKEFDFSCPDDAFTVQFEAIPCQYCGYQCTDEHGCDAFTSDGESAAD